MLSRKAFETLKDRIICASALPFLEGLPDDCIDMGITSPPYDNLRTYKGYSFDFEAIARQLYRVLKPGGVLVWVVGDQTKDFCESLTSFKQVIYFVEGAGFKLHDTMIWDKASTFEPANVRYAQVFEYMFVLSKGKPNTFNPIMRPNANAGQIVYATSRKADGSVEAIHGNGELHKPESPLPNVWQINTGYMKTTTDKDAYDHPAMFPETLAERHVLTWSNPGDIVLDCFMGSGTTAKMARKNGRHYIGCDISPEYINGIAIPRLNKPYTESMFAA
jgi:DNA modification methylase